LERVAWSQPPNIEKESDVDRTELVEKSSKYDVKTPRRSILPGAVILSVQPGIIEKVSLPADVWPLT
jgi:hypothetical protein